MAGLVHNPEAVATELEDGAVLLNMETGFYYSLNASGLEIWRLVESGLEAGELGQALAERLEVEPEHAAAVAAALMEELQRESLLVPSQGDTGRRDVVVAPAPPQRRPFTEPELVKHDEPLHEVSISPFDPQLPLAE